MKPVEVKLFEFLKEKFDASASGSVLYELELHDTLNQKITKQQGVRISEAVGDLAPGPGGGLSEHDVLLFIVCFAKVLGKDKTKRQAALQEVFDIQLAVCQLLISDSTLGTRVCDLVIRRGGRGYDVLEGNPYAVANMPLIINPSGRRFQE